MQSLVKNARRLARRDSVLVDERGLSTVEYVIILVLIAVLCIGVWKTFGEAVHDRIDASTERMDSDVVVAPAQD